MAYLLTCCFAPTVAPRQSWNFPRKWHLQNLQNRPRYALAGGLAKEGTYRTYKTLVMFMVYA
jgi:hypothetical protein